MVEYSATVALPMNDEHERSRRVLYRPDGSVAGTEDRELWRAGRQPAALLPPGTSAFWADVKEGLLLLVGLHILLAVAVAGGALAKWTGHNPVIGYALAWWLMFWFGVRPKL
jgi:hypothetical protein